MGHSDYPHNCVDNLVDHAVGIRLQDEASRASAVPRPAVRSACDQVEGVIERNQEAISRLWTPLSVIQLPIGDISLSLREQPEFTCVHAAT